MIRNLILTTERVADTVSDAISTIYRETQPESQRNVTCLKQKVQAFP
jgi:hypothetical protein